MNSGGDTVLGRLDGRLREWVEERGFSGVAVITRGGVTEFEGCYGLANRSEGVPVRAGTRFGLASLTRMFTAVSVVELVRRGLVGFDTPVVKVLPAGDAAPGRHRAPSAVAHLRDRGLLR